MTKRILIIGIFVLALALPMTASAICRWVPYDKSECKPGGKLSGWQGAPDDSYCNQDENKSVGTTCCCAADALDMPGSLDSAIGCCGLDPFTYTQGNIQPAQALILSHKNCTSINADQWYTLPIPFPSTNRRSNLPYPLFDVVDNSPLGFSVGKECVSADDKCFWVFEFTSCQGFGKPDWWQAPTGEESRCDGTSVLEASPGVPKGICCCGPKVPKTVVTSPAQATGMVRSVYKTLPNPLGPEDMAIKDLPTIIGKVINALLGIIGAIALLIFVYGGFVWMTAAGNESKVAQGRNILLWATVAIIIIFLSWMLVAFFFQALGV